MASSKKDLSWALGVDNAAFIAGMREAQKHAEKSAAAIKAVMITAAVAIGFAFTGKEIAGMVEGVLKAGKALDTLSRQSGFAASEIKMMEHALDRSGVSAEGATEIMTDLRDKLYEVSRGNAALGNTYARYGVDVAKLKGMGIAEQFQAVAKAVNGIVNPTMRAQIATELLGDAGAKAAANLRPDDFERAARLFGGTSEALAKASAGLARAHDSWERIKTTGQGVFEMIVSRLAPAFERVAEKLEGVLPKIFEVADKVGTTLNDAFEGLVGLFEEGRLSEAIKLAADIGITYAKIGLAKLFEWIAEFLAKALSAAFDAWWDSAKEILSHPLTSQYSVIGMAGRAAGLIDSSKDKGFMGKMSAKLFSGDAKEFDELEAKQRKLALMMQSGITTFNLNHGPLPSSTDTKPGQGPGGMLNAPPVLAVFDTMRRVGGGIGNAAATIPQQQLDVAKGQLAMLSDIKASLAAWNNRTVATPVQAFAGVHP